MPGTPTKSRSYHYLVPYDPAGHPFPHIPAGSGLRMVAPSLAGKTGISR